jgi:hypothetical protein
MPWGPFTEAHSKVRIVVYMILINLFPLIPSKRNILLD